MNNYTLRDYQAEAIHRFEDNSFTGILEMATGTGKTLTAITASENYYKTFNKQFLVIIVPFLHLIDQWINDLLTTSMKTYMIIAYGKMNWYAKLKRSIWEYNNGFRDRVVIIGSYKSMASKEFQHLVTTVRYNKFLIADECHYLGSNRYEYNNFIDFEGRLGLSATPKRWWDEHGTRQMFKIFNRVVYEYSMEEAIRNRYLCEYEYNPILVRLSEDEIYIYEAYTKKIGALLRIPEKTKNIKEEIERLLRKRSSIISKAENKIPAFLKEFSKQEDKKHTLVYCAPGQIDGIISLISRMGVKVHRFNSQVNYKDRKKILKLFSEGIIEVLVAIKCLDEGVDVPSTKNAYFLSSTSNPREFVQRRGRILRTSELKNKAYLYDFLILQDNIDFKTFDSIARKELPRYAEFSSVATNRFQNSTRNEIKIMLAKYGLDRYLNLKPWDLYELMLEENGGNNEFTV